MLASQRAHYEHIISFLKGYKLFVKRARLEFCKLETCVFGCEAPGVVSCQTDVRPSQTWYLYSTIHTCTLRYCITLMQYLNWIATISILFYWKQNSNLSMEIVLWWVWHRKACFDGIITGWYDCWRTKRFNLPPWRAFHPAPSINFSKKERKS